MQRNACEPSISDILLYLVTDTALPVPKAVANAPGFRLVPVNCRAAMDGFLVLLAP